jgi:hypothetical protein
MQLVRHQQVEVHRSQAGQCGSAPSPPILSRAQRAHYRLSWGERLARNARAIGQGSVSIRLFGISPAFAALLGLAARLRIPYQA